MTSESDNSNAQSIIPMAITEAEFKSKDGVKAFIGGTTTKKVPVIEGQKSLVQYLQQPANEYSTNVMRGYNKSIQRIDETNFLFETEAIDILGTQFQPLIIAEVIVDNERGGTKINVKSIQIKTADPEV